MKYTYLIIFLIVSSQICSAQRYFMKTPQNNLTTGESTVNGYTDFIEIESFNFDVTKPYTNNYGGSNGSIEANPSILKVTKPITYVSPLFLRAVQKVTAIPVVEIWGINNLTSALNPFPFVKYEFKDCRIISMNTGGNDGQDNSGLEDIGIVFSKVKITYTQTNSIGLAGASHTYQWSFKDNSNAGY